MKLSEAAPVPVGYSAVTSLLAVAGEANSSDFSGTALYGESIPAGQLSRIVSVGLKGDTVQEGNERFLLKLGSATGGATILDGEAYGTILNDDGNTLSIGDVAVVEGDSGIVVPLIPHSRYRVFRIDSVSPIGRLPL